MDSPAPRAVAVSGKIVRAEINGTDSIARKSARTLKSKVIPVSGLVRRTQQIEKH